MKNKYYFSVNDDDGSCFTLDYWQHYLKDNCLTQIELLEAKRELTSGYFFCKEFGEVGEVGQGCGKSCDAYKPNNGKSGRCKHYGFVYEPTENKIILELHKTILGRYKNIYTILKQKP